MGAVVVIGMTFTIPTAETPAMEAILSRMFCCMRSIELAGLYTLDFMTLAKWAGWTGDQPQNGERGDSTSLVVRRVLELNDTQRAQVLSYIEQILRERRT